MKDELGPLNALGDVVLTYRPKGKHGSSKPKRLPRPARSAVSVESWVISIADIFEDSSLRLDASHFDL